jgi:hypothetical protein
MTGLRGGTPHHPAQTLRLHAHAVTYALAAALAITLAVLAVVLATSGGSSPAADPVRVAPSSGPIPPSAAERHQQPGLDGPGMRP